MNQPHTIVQGMLVTEKGTRHMESENQYQFRVHPGANKIEIKRAVETLFKVNVTNVNTLNRMGKKKRERTQNFGRTAAWKKAVVTLKDGESIDLA
jgi:large subunit ribosomal protein L23